MSDGPRQVRFAQEPGKTALYSFNDILRTVGHSVGDPDSVMTLTISVKRDDLEHLSEISKVTGEDLYVMFTLGVMVDEQPATSPVEET